MPDQIATDLSAFVSLVDEMRRLQRDYFKTRRGDVLDEAKAAERMVDRAVDGFRSRGFGPPESTGERRS